MMSASIAAQAMAISAALPEATGPNERLAGMSLYIRKVYAALPEPPDSMTRPEIIAATGLPNGSVKQAIWELQRAGLVAGTPKIARDFSKYWRV
jgi:DNA-binding transcriptional regulator GbsR (MarR family)